MISDPLMGIIADRTNTRWGKFRPYILWMALPYSVLAVLTFTTPDLGQTGKIIYAGVTYMMLMTVFTAINLPYSSLGAVMTSDSYERAGLNSYRFIFAFIGQFIVTGTALTLAKYFGNGDSAKGYQYTLILFAIVSFILFMITFKTTKERVEPPKAQKQNLKEDLKNLFSNKPWVILFFVGIISFVMFAMQNLSIAYYFKYYIGSEESVQLFNIIGTVALIIGIPLSKPLAKKFGKKNVFIASSLISGLFFILLYIPDAGDTTLIYTFNILAKFMYAPAVPLLWTMLADTADFSEWKNGRRATGLVFSAATFAQKAGWGIGGALAGWILALYNFIPNMEQTLHSLIGIKLMVSVFPGVLYMSCAILLYFYTIDHKTCLIMQKDLENRREQNN
jgi:GPH family glycoside/pentoside/hexuronide:cation symporter